MPAYGEEIMGSIGYVSQDFADVTKAFRGANRSFEKIITAKLPIDEAVSSGLVC
ncbi:hypothetical protein V1515DRAFT_603709 [Lipomyces mesembrius]